MTIVSVYLFSWRFFKLCLKVFKLFVFWMVLCRLFHRGTNVQYSIGKKSTNAAYSALTEKTETNLKAPKF